ncbi:hypothetical protein [Mitsuaria sp. GD03876]|nr:hypothetical protein [Mitsuaria sp. GD03876]MDH0867814.1 hypothetical protein [Mitsuaria sp. GD03876]
MKRLLFALLFLFGGVAHEVRHPLQCSAIVSGARRRSQGARSDDA